MTNRLLSTLEESAILESLRDIPDHLRVTEKMKEEIIAEELDQIIEDHGLVKIDEVAALDSDDVDRQIDGFIEEYWKDTLEIMLSSTRGPRALEVLERLVKELKEQATLGDALSTLKENWSE